MCPEYTNEFWCYVWDWQTLISGLAAVLVASVTVAVISCQLRLQGNQIRSEENRHQDRLTSMALSARSRLPNALSDLSGYAEKCMRRLKQRRFDQLRDIDFPESAAERVQDAIEFADPISARILYELTAHLQLIRARLRDLKADISDHYLLELMYDAVLLQAYANHSFKYARNQEQSISDIGFSTGIMSTALNNCAQMEFVLQHEALFAPLREMIERRHRDGKIRGQIS